MLAESFCIFVNHNIKATELRNLPILILELVILDRGRGFLHSFRDTILL